MKSIALFVLSTMCAWAMVAASASAETIDVSTISCEKLTTAYKAKSDEDLSFVNGVLNWLGGYHATEEQGTVVDWDKLSDAFNKTVEYCFDHPGVSALSASEQFMGEEISEATPKSYDLAIVTCEAALTNPDLKKNMGDTFLWLEGYHASYNNGSTMLDLDKFTKDVGHIADYCAANPKAGLVTAAEKYMAQNEE
jgi:hypothetical protein